MAGDFVQQTEENCGLWIEACKPISWLLLSLNWRGLQNGIKIYTDIHNINCAEASLKWQGHQYSYLSVLNQQAACHHPADHSWFRGCGMSVHKIRLVEYRIRDVKGLSECIGICVIWRARQILHLPQIFSSRRQSKRPNTLGNFATIRNKTVSTRVVRHACKKKDLSENKRVRKRRLY